MAPCARAACRTDSDTAVSGDLAALAGMALETLCVSVAFFQMIYQVLLGQERGPRFGSFVALYGIDNTRELICRALAGEDLSKG